MTEYRRISIQIFTARKELFGGQRSYVTSEMWRKSHCNDKPIKSYKLLHSCFFVSTNSSVDIFLEGIRYQREFYT